MPEEARRMTMAEIMDALDLHDQVMPLEDLERLPSTPEAWLQQRIRGFESGIRPQEELVAEHPGVEWHQEMLADHREELQRLQEIRNPAKEVRSRKAAVTHDALRDGRLEAWEINDLAELMRAQGKDPKKIQENLLNLAWTLMSQAEK